MVCVHLGLLLPSQPRLLLPEELLLLLQELLLKRPQKTHLPGASAERLSGRRSSCRQTKQTPRSRETTA